jgi:hypothetical protein
LNILHNFFLAFVNIFEIATIFLVKFIISTVPEVKIKVPPSPLTCKPLLGGDNFKELKRKLRQNKDKV